MNRTWALSLPPESAAQLEADYEKLMGREQAQAAVIPANELDAYTELVGFPARVVGLAGLIFMADRAIQHGTDVAANQKKIEQLRADLEAQVGNFNTNVARGKWNRIMPGLVTGKALTSWNSQVRWPWGETAAATIAVNTNDAPWRDAAAADREFAQGAAHWSAVEGLGPSGRAMALQPESLAASWREDDTNAPALEYSFASRGGDAVAFVDFLPTFRIYPGMKLRVAVRVDNQAATLIEVPGSSGAENENGTVRSAGVQDNYTRARIPLPSLAAGNHIFTIRAVDPGVVIDRVSLP
jgi:hypothetical protein